MATTTTHSYEFQEPANMRAIRSNIMQRIKKRNDPTDMPNISFQPKQPFHVTLDSGLPSPPIESCTYEEEQTYTEIMPSPSATLPDSPPSPTLSKSSTHLESADAIREKIRLLKQEKHVLFQTMKGLLSQPQKSDIKSKPAIRSRSQSEHSRPRYNNYKTQRFGYRYPPPPNQTMSRRNSSYVSSRSQLIIRPPLPTFSFRPSSRRY